MIIKEDFLARENSFSIDMKFKMLVLVYEGTVPVPPCRPCAERMMTEHLCGSYRIGGATAEEMKPP
jgi:hypothetical protein